MVDITAKLAELRARKAAETASIQIKTLSINENNNDKTNSSPTMESSSRNSIPSSESIQSIAPKPIANSNPVSSISVLESDTKALEGITNKISNGSIGTGEIHTQNIEHIEFLSKMNTLANALHTQHPSMPVLLMQIHKQIKSDPELSILLDEDAIGIIVKGLEVQTKTELAVKVAKQSKAADKKTKLSVDML